MSAAPTIPAIVLAAGRSTRMGHPKAALPLPGGETLLSRVLDTLAAAGASPLVVVVGRDGETVREAATAAATPVPVVFADNPDPDRGQLSSLAVGIDALPPGVPAALVTLVDVALPRPSTVRALLSRWRTDRAQLVRPTRRGRHGHPFVAGRDVLEALRSAPAGLTARDVLQPWLPGVEVIVEDEGPFEDVDTPEEYERLLRRLREAP